MVYTPTLMGDLIKGNGQMENNMEREPSSLHKDNIEKEYGKKERESDGLMRALKLKVHKIMMLNSDQYYLQPNPPYNNILIVHLFLTNKTNKEINYLYTFELIVM